MTAPRDPDSILTTITPAQRVPSIGTQLTMPAGAGDWAPSCCPHCGFTGRDHRHSLPPVRPTIERAPQPLNLWDTSADSIPETWSL